MENRRIVTELLRHSECVRYIDLGEDSGRAALHEAAARGYIEIINDLLVSGANVDVPDNSYMTPLHLTVWYDGSKKLTFGAEVNTKDKAGNTPLHDACAKGDLNMVSLLLSFGADAGVRNTDGKTPPNIIPEGHEEIRQLFKRPWGISERKTIANIPGERPVCPERNRKACDDASVYVRSYWRGRAESWATSTSVSNLVYDETGLREISEQFKTIIETRLPTTGEVGLAEGETWRWIHFSANNMTWIKDLVWLITHSKGYDRDERSRAWSFWDRTTNDREGAGAGSTRVPHAEDSWKEDRYRENIISSDNRSSKVRASLAGNETSDRLHEEKMMESSWEKASSEERGKARLFPKKRSLSLVVPFIDFETEPYLTRREVKNVGEHLKKMLDLFHLYSPYTGKDGLQIPKTLDESYYDMLNTERIAERDGDQVVYKWFRDKEANQRDDKLNELLDYFSRYRTLRVLQDEATIIGSEDSEKPLSEGDERRSTSAKEPIMRSEPNSRPDSTEIVQIEALHDQPPSDKAKATLEDIPVKDCGSVPTTDDVPKLLMVHQLWLWKLGDNTVITCCPDRCHAGAEDTLIDTIRQGGIESMHEPDDLIEHILYECATFLDKFRDAGPKAHVLDIFDNRIAKMSDQEVVHFKQFSKDMKDAKESGKASSGRTRSITDEISLLYEVKDIRDELNLVRRVFEAQAGVLEKFSRLFWPGLQEQSKRCREGFLEDCGIKALIDRATRLDEDAKKTLEALDYLVQVKQAQSSLDEAEAARRLNNYIVLFTIVTIIFTPLSFMTSLFTVPINQFPHDNNSNLSYDTTWFTGRMFAGELTTLAVIFIIIMFQMNPSWLTTLEYWMRQLKFEVHTILRPNPENFSRPWRSSEEYPESWRNSEEYLRPWRTLGKRRSTFHDAV
ncbi:hypothetical protein F4825DRAFT_283176 [Nemania diffusa]|nr:hypothetical protein F4825DRAFT_283176 [Nemania diffusa]